MIVKQQVMEVLDVDLSPSVLIKDWGMEPFLSFWTHASHLFGQIRWTDREVKSSAQVGSQSVRVRIGGEPLLFSKGRCLKVMIVMVA
jgi:hypothetical protein